MIEADRSSRHARSVADLGPDRPMDRQKSPGEGRGQELTPIRQHDVTPGALPADRSALADAQTIAGLPGVTPPDVVTMPRGATIRG
jgi:hypothetical protein